jgi:hypothetical protein
MRLFHSPKVFYDCTTQYMTDMKVLARWIEIEIAFEATVKELGLWWAFALGLDAVSGTDPITHTSNLTTLKTLPVTTLRYGHNDGVDVGRIVKDAFVDQIRVRSRRGFDSTLQCEMTIVASGAVVDATGTTWPECYDGTEIALTDSRGLLTINGVDYITMVSEISAALNNNSPREALFAGGSVELNKVIRGTRRTYAFAAQIEGIDAPANALATLARAESGKGTSVTNTEWRAGTASSNQWSFKIPKGLLHFGDQPQDSLPENLGDLEVLNLVVDPQVSKPKAASEPCQSVSVIPAAEQAGAFLLT